MEQSTSPNGPWSNQSTKGELERLRKGITKRECSQNWGHSSPERDTGCMFQLWGSGTLCLQLPHKTEVHQHTHSPTHWLEPGRQWKWLGDNHSQFHLSTAEHSPKRRPRRADDENGGSRGKFFGGLICAAWIRRTGSDRMYFSIWKSMQLCLFIHLLWKRAKQQRFWIQEQPRIL